MKPAKRITIRMPDGSLFDEGAAEVAGSSPARGLETVPGRPVGRERPSPSSELAAALVQAAEQAAAHGALPDFAIVNGVELRPRRRRKP